MPGFAATHEPFFDPETPVATAVRDTLHIEEGKSQRALVRRPGTRVAQGIVTHIERHPVDVGRALDEWAAYCEALAHAGWVVVEVEPDEDCPDSVFVEDTMVVHGGLAVIARPGVESRLPETAGAEAAIRALGLPVERITAPGTLDGGDVLVVDDAVYVGTGGRTNAEGARQLRELLGVHVVEIPIAGVLHLKSAVTALPDGTIVGYPGLGLDATVFPSFLAVPEPTGAHVVVLGPDKVLVSADCPHSAELFYSRGFQPFVVEIGEFQKLEGCVTCLSVLVSL
jgi:dimethylargininase